MNLLEVSLGVWAEIVRVDLESELRDFAESRGVFVGNVLRIVRRYKSRVLAEINQSVFLLPSLFAKNIEVKIL